MFSNKTLLTKRQHTLFGAWIIVCQLLALEIIENQGRTKFEKIVNYISIKMPKTIKSQTKRKKYNNGWEFSRNDRTILRFTRPKNPKWEKVKIKLQLDKLL